MKVLEGVPALHRFVLEDYDMKTLPEYMPNVNPKHLQLDCSLELLTSIAEGQSGAEWDKFRHIQQMKAYADDGDNKRKWYVLYTKRDLSFKLETNIVVSSSGPAVAVPAKCGSFDIASRSRWHYILMELNGATH